MHSRIKAPLGLMECHHGVIWPWFDSTDQNNRQQMSHLEYWNQILVHPFSSSRTHGFRITSKLNITSCVNARPGWGGLGPTFRWTADSRPGQRPPNTSGGNIDTVFIQVNILQFCWVINRTVSQMECSSFWMFYSRPWWVNKIKTQSKHKIVVHINFLYSDGLV